MTPDNNYRVNKISHIMMILKRKRKNMEYLWYEISKQKMTEVFWYRVSNEPIPETYQNWREKWSIPELCLFQRAKVEIPEYRWCKRDKYWISIYLIFYWCISLLVNPNGLASGQSCVGGNRVWLLLSCVEGCFFFDFFCFKKISASICYWLLRWTLFDSW